jgi:uncharacterized protein (TIGR02145 family)
MKIKFTFLSVLLTGLAIILILNCKKQAITLPTVTTESVSEITATSAAYNGIVSADGGAQVVARGICRSSNQTPTILDTKTSDATGLGSFSGTMSGLTPGATYFIRAYATNSIGTAYGNQLTLTTLAILPEISTIEVSDITTTTASGGGTITSDGGGSVSARGVCWAKGYIPTVDSSKTTDGTGIGSFKSNITGLTINTQYTLRAYATNKAGTAYGSAYYFSTNYDNKIIFNPSLNYGTMTDIEGNIYKTIRIGTQEWMAENLRTTKFNDGSAIPLVTDNSIWTNPSTSAFCWSGNNEAVKNIYGALYNWTTVGTGKLSPVGWHVPSDDEWSVLITYLGGKTVAGDRLREKGLGHWYYYVNSQDTEKTNDSGFTALPGGYREHNGPFSSYGYEAIWWSSTSIGSDGWWWSLGSGVVARMEYNQTFGLSVRCVKD